MTDTTLQEKKPLSVTFLGAPSFAADLLAQLHDHADELGIEITLVISAADKPVGRKKIITPTAVTSAARARSIPVSHSLDDLTTDCDLAIVYAYGMIIPHAVLDRPRHGFWNIHPSLLPLYRGAAPIVMPIAHGDQTTGVTLMQMDAQLDHGPLIDQRTVPLLPGQTRGQLEEGLTRIAGELLFDAVQRLVQTGSVTTMAQDHSMATTTRTLRRDDGYLDRSIIQAASRGESQPVPVEQFPVFLREYHQKHPDHPVPSMTAATLIDHLLRALHDWPGIWTTCEIAGATRRLKILSIDQPSEGIVRPAQVQLEGKAAVSYRDFSAAYPSAI